jgi:methylthioribulose-1-phosphate dehydratase
VIHIHPFATTLSAVGAALHHVGWLRATGGNLSCRLDPSRFLITASGVSKGSLTDDDYLVVDGDVITPSGRKPSAETAVHAKIYECVPAAECVLHVHSPYAAVVSRHLSRRSASGDVAVRVPNYEFIKALGFWDDPALIEIPVVPNYPAIPELAVAVGTATRRGCPGVLVAGHGTYAWGSSVDDAQRHVEAIEELCRYLWLEASAGWSSSVE